MITLNLLQVYDIGLVFLKPTKKPAATLEGAVEEGRITGILTVPDVKQIQSDLRVKPW